MFFQETTPDTSGYMIAGYAIAFLVMALYVASIYIRSRSLKQDMTILEELEESAPAVKTPAAKAAPADQLRRNGSRPANNKSVKTVTKPARKR
jgi:hypothetical protein